MIKNAPYLLKKLSSKYVNNEGLFFAKFLNCFVKKQWDPPKLSNTEEQRIYGWLSIN